RRGVFLTPLVPTAAIRSNNTVCRLFRRFFFFSSRRRHTRFSRDWSSDVCSSDLGLPHAPFVGAHAPSGYGTARRSRAKETRCRRSEERRVGKECRSRWG